MHRICIDIANSTTFLQYRMAITEVVPGIQVSVLISGKAAPEFPDPGTDATSGCRTTTRYIESRDDATLAVHVVASTDYAWDYKDHAVKAVLFADGGYVENCIIGEMGASETLHGPRRYDVSTGEWSARGMKFSSVRTGEVFVSGVNLPPRCQIVT